jgi:DNA-binding NarL/FixJ family response regulator
VYAGAADVGGVLFSNAITTTCGPMAAALGFTPRRSVLGHATISCGMLTVLIVDDHEAFRRTARALLEASGFDVVGEAGDGTSAVAEAERLLPRLVVLDVHLPDLDGFEVAARLNAVSGPPAVVLVSSRSESSYRRRLAESSALGFIVKDELSGETLGEFLA